MGDMSLASLVARSPLVHMHHNYSWVSLLCLFKPLFFRVLSSPYRLHCRLPLTLPIYITMHTLRKPDPLPHSPHIHIRTLIHFPTMTPHCYLLERAYLLSNFDFFRCFVYDIFLAVIFVEVIG